MTESDALLSNLCSICHIREHRYKCPRCAILTCSLPCVKRHKLWAQCNGVRNPAAYIKHADLVTPAGIDHDYNYLTSIERQFDKADREATFRGIVLEESQTEKKAGPKKGQEPLNAALERNEVIVAKAPKGMHRSKTNETKWLRNSKCLEWTVEWVHPGGKKQLAQCKDSIPVSEAYRYLTRHETRKRKTTSDTQDSTRKGQRQVSSSLNRQTDSGDQNGIRNDEISAVADVEDQKFDNNQPAKGVTLSFYLHTPSLPSRYPVLALLEPDLFLSTALRNRLVLEYPTIYVFDQGQDDSLPEGFLTERQFFEKMRKEKIEELDEGEIVEDLNGEGDHGEGREAMDVIAKLDEKKLLEVLGKDIKAR